MLGHRVLHVLKRQGWVLSCRKSDRRSFVVGPRIVDRRTTGLLPCSGGGRLSFIETGEFGIAPIRQVRIMANVPIVVVAAADEAVVQKEVSRRLLSEPRIALQRQRREDALFFFCESVSVRGPEHLRFVQGRDARRRREAAHRSQAGRGRSVLMRHMARERERERTRRRAVVKLGGLRGRRKDVVLVGGRIAEGVVVRKTVVVVVVVVVGVDQRAERTIRRVQSGWPGYRKAVERGGPSRSALIGIRVSGQGRSKPFGRRRVRLLLSRVRRLRGGGQFSRGEESNWQ